MTGELKLVFVVNIETVVVSTVAVTVLAACQAAGTMMDLEDHQWVAGTMILQEDRQVADTTILQGDQA